jgi:hypothetical protein
VIEYDLASQLALFKEVGGALQSAGSGVKRAAIGIKVVVVDYWPIALVVALPLAIIVLWRRRHGAVSFLPGHRPRRRDRSPIAQLYDDTARALARAGVPREAAVTPRELARRLADRDDDVAPKVSELTELYYAAAWGDRHDEAAEQRAADLAREIRATLHTRRAPR